MTAFVENATTVNLKYVINFGTPVTIAMLDNGLSGDGGAGDGVYGATIPAQSVSTLIRYRVDATMTTRLMGFPRDDDTVTYTGDYIADTSVITGLTLFHWLMAPADYNYVVANTADACSPRPAMLYYDGTLYDGALVHARGASDDLGYAKKHWKFLFPRNHYFYAPELGVVIPVDRFNLQSSWTDKSHLREHLSYRLFQDVGQPSCVTSKVRVQLNGQFYGLYTYFEQPDDDFLERNGLDKDAGTYYQAASTNDTTDCRKMTLATLQGGTTANPRWEKHRPKESLRDFNDIFNFLTDINDSNATRNFIFDNIDIPRMLNYWAALIIMHENDSVAKNYYLYRDTAGTGRWFMTPWDKDLTWGRNWDGSAVNNDKIWANVDTISGRTLVTPSHPQFGDNTHKKYDYLWNRLTCALFKQPDILQMYYRRLRTVMDEQLQPPGTPYAQRKLEKHIDELVAVADTEATMDLAKWGSWGTIQTMARAAQIMEVNYLDVRRTHLFVTHRVAGEIPTAQTPGLPIIINEIMYNPTGGDANEFIELYNPSSTEYVDMSDWELDGAALKFLPGTVLPPLSYLVVVKNDVQFRATYGSGKFVAAQYNGSLDNGGENLVLKDKQGNVIDEVRYDDDAPWPTSPDAGGKSLELIDVSQNNNRPINWAASTSTGGTPGASNSAAGTTPSIPNLWVNELLLFNGSINIDEKGEYEPWIEIHNASASSIDLGGMFLTDDYNNPTKWAIPAGTVLNGGQWMIFWADAEPNDGTLHTNFRLNTAGGSVGLYTSTSKIVDYLNYDPLPTNISYGKYPDGTSLRREFTTPTPAAQNYITPPPVILNEYNAVADSMPLKDNGSDTFWGQVLGNGGDWFELAVIQDHLDMRGWKLEISDDTGGAGHTVQTLTLTNNNIWSDLRSGTIITVSENLPDNISNYDPAGGYWWINVQAKTGASGTYITATSFKVTNNNWQLTIRNSSSTVVFGPAGEGIKPVTGIGNDEVFKLEEDPGPYITERANYNGGTSSTFGSENIYAGGTLVQDFSALRNIPDTHAPKPDAMTWKTVPTATGSTSITMIATTATDISGVEYYFECTTGNGHNSGWQNSPYYKDKGLQPGVTYTYRVKARDSAPVPNETGWSGNASAVTTITPVEFIAAGAITSSASAITPALPSGIATGDILLLFLETGNETITIPTQNGGTWAQVTNSPQGTGTTGTSGTGTRLTVFWSRYNGTQGAPTTSDSNEHQMGRIVAFRGTVPSGIPWDVTAGGVEATSDTSGSIPGATTTVNNTLIVAAIAASLPDSTSTTNFNNTWTNTDLTSITERIDNAQSAGNGGALGIATGAKATTGAYADTGVTLTTAALKGMMSIALKPEAGVSPPGQATSPNPANAATNVVVTTDLSWTAGLYATSHDVYFGTSSPGTFRGNQTATTFDTGTIDYNTTYYWRIDEKNANGTTTGDVWSFTTAGVTPTFIAAGAITSSASAITPALPSGIATGDILLLFLETGNETITIPTQNGGTWAQVTNSPQGTGTTGTSGTGTRLTVFWSRYNGTQGAPTTSDSNEHQMGRIVAFRGTVPSGIPWDVTAGGVEATSDTSGSIPGATTTVNNTLIVAAIAASLPDSTSTTNFNNTWTNTDLTSITERIDNAQSAGNGGALGIATGAKATTGAYGNTAVTLTTAALKGMMSIALKPATPPGQATSPNPANAATNVAVTTDLSWTADSGATSHDVYFGTAASPPLVSSSQTATTYDTGTMSNNTTYYWRIDEKNANGTTTGVPWSFTTETGVETHTVTFVEGANGSITGTLVQVVAHGGNCTAVTAVPYANYHFTGWTGSYVGMTNPLTITNVTADMTITANFAIDTHTVTFIEGANGSITGTLVQVVAHGGNCTAVTAVPYANYHFTGWTGSYVGMTNPLTITNVTADMTITANFAIDTHTVTFIEGANGSITGTLVQVVAHGGNCTAVTAVPYANYHFTGWTGSYVGMTNPLTITNVTADMTITANFAIDTHTVTFIEGANGSITGTLVQVVAHGGNCTAVTAVPYANYHFTGWTGSYVGMTNPLTITNVTADMTITANFAIDTHTVTFIEGANGSITGTLVQVVAHGGNCTAVTAVPYANYHFTGWTGSYVGMTNPLTITNVTADMTITANFAIDTFTLNYAAGTGGSLTGETSQVVDYNTSGTAVTAVPNTGYHFVKWSDESTDNPRTDLNVTANIAVTASFAIYTFTLDYAAGTGGSLTGETSQVVDYNTSGTAVTAVPNTGYHFVKWSDESTDNPRTDLNVTANIAVTASFAIYTFTLDYAAGTGGSLTGETSQVVDYNTSGTAVTAVPNTGYHFVKWSDESTDNPRTDLNVTANIAVTASFAIYTFTLDYAAGTGGSLTGETSQVVDYNTSGTAVTAVPNTGYHFVKWSDESTDNPRTDTNVKANVDVTASFAIYTFTLDYAAGTGGSLTGETSQVVDYNTSGTAVTAVPNTGYHFVKWSDESTDNPRTDLNVTANIAVTASFAQNVYTLTINKVGNGTVTANKEAPYHYGDVVQLTANPDTGWVFTSWSGDLSGSENPKNITIDGNKTVTANFAAAIKSNGTGGGNWNTGTTWIGGVVPGVTDNVIIQGSDVVTLIAAGSCANLTMDAGTTLSLNATSLVIPGTSWNFATTSTVVYNGTTTIQSAPVYGNLTYSSSANGSPNGNLTINGNLSITANTLRGISATGGTFTHNVAGNVNISGTGIITAVNSSNTTTARCTWNIGGNLTLGSTSNRMQLYESSGPHTGSAVYNINGNLTVGSTSQIMLKSTTPSTANYPEGIINLKGNLVHNGTIGVNSATSGTSPGLSINFVGTSPQDWSGSGTFSALAFSVNMNINNAAGVTLSRQQDISTNTVVILTNGKLTTTSTNLLRITNGSLVGGSSSSYINGPLTKQIMAGPQNQAFPVGDATTYAPVSLTFGNVVNPATVKVSTTPGMHPQIATSGFDSSKTLNRYYTMTNSGVTFDNVTATFNFDPTDVIGDADPTKYVVKKFDTGTWTTPTTANPLATSIQATGMTSLSDFAVGQLPQLTISGHVTEIDANIPVEGVLIEASNDGGSDTTDANGYYEVVVDYNWSGKVVPSKYAYAFEPNSITYANVTEDKAEVQNYVGTLLTYTITGYIKNACGTPIEGVFVDANNLSTSDISDANGYYEVWVADNWSGTVTPSKAHYTFDPSSKAYTNVLENKTGQDYLADNIYDLDCDGSIGFGDVAVISENWLSSSPEKGDLNSDGIVNFVDFADFADVWQD